MLVGLYETCPAGISISSYPDGCYSSDVSIQMGLDACLAAGWKIIIFSAVSLSSVFIPLLIMCSWDTFYLPPPLVPGFEQIEFSLVVKRLSLALFSRFLPEGDGFGNFEGPSQLF